MTDVKNAIPPEYARNYILGGRCTVGFHSLKTGNTLWYYVDRDRMEKNRWWVKIHWSIPESDRFLGMIKLLPPMNNSASLNNNYIYYPPHNLQQRSVLVKEYTSAFEYSWKAIITGKVPDSLIILHKGRCSYCGRPLSDAESLMKGLGPVCRKNLGYE